MGAERVIQSRAEIVLLRYSFPSGETRHSKRRALMHSSMILVISQIKDTFSRIFLDNVQMRAFHDNRGSETICGP